MLMAMENKIVKDMDLKIPYMAHLNVGCWNAETKKYLELAAANESGLATVGLAILAHGELRHHTADTADCWRHACDLNC